jgi:hypothetical protein
VKWILYEKISLQDTNLSSKHASYFISSLHNHGESRNSLFLSACKLDYIQLNIITILFNLHSFIERHSLNYLHESLLWWAMGIKVTVGLIMHLLLSSLSSRLLHLHCCCRRRHFRYSPHFHIEQTFIIACQSSLQPPLIVRRKCNEWWWVI